MFQIIEVQGIVSPRKVVKGSAETFEAAKELARVQFGAVELEDDVDYPGCADFLTVGGLVMSIEPKGFVL